MIDIDEARFEDMVGEALEGLPEQFSRALSNLVITVEDGDDPHLLGLYQGIPLTGRSADYSAAMPDKITIYRRSICGVCDSERQVVEQVRATVVHEIGHHFGIDDERLHELGW